MTRELGAYGRKEDFERFATLTEVKAEFKKLLNGRTAQREHEQGDSTGLLVYEVWLTETNGEKIGYAYKRATNDFLNPDLPSTARYSGSIHLVRYDNDWNPIGGECVANYLDGVWTYPT